MPLIHKRGPYAGLHPEIKDGICPPEWNLSPHDYWVMTAAPSRIAHGYTWWSRIDTSPLDNLDPALVLTYEDLPAPLRILIHYVARNDTRISPEKRVRHRHLAYDTTAACLKVGRETGDWTLANLATHCPDELKALTQFRMSFPLPHVTRATETVALALAQKRGARVGATSATTKAPPATWETATRTHDRISEEWGAIITDRLSGLTHPTLLDVAQPRTARFIEAYGQAEDLRKAHGSAATTPTDQTWVEKYVAAVHRADEAWTEAVRHSERTAKRSSAAGKVADILHKATATLRPPTIH